MKNLGKVWHPDEKEMHQPPETKFSIKPEDFQLGRLESIASAGILEEAIFQLAIVGNIERLPNQNHAYHLRYARRNHNLSPENIDSDIIESRQDTIHRNQYIKFQKDLQFVQNVLQDTADSLRTKTSYDCLMKHLDQYYKKYHEEKEILESEVKNKSKLEKLKIMLVKERYEGIKEIETHSKLLGGLKDQLEDLMIESEMKSNYIANWQRAKGEQNSIKLNDEEMHFMRSIRKSEKKIDREMRIDAEIEEYIEEAIKDLEDKINSWVEKYNQEISKRDAEIEELNKRRQAQLNQMQELSNLFEERKTEIDNYLEEKEQKKREAELLKEMNTKATKIQAWWKGIMVRRGLGPFSKRKGKDKSVKKKGKKSNS